MALFSSPERAAYHRQWCEPLLKRTLHKLSPDGAAQNGNISCVTPLGFFHYSATNQGLTPLPVILLAYF